MPRRVCSSKRLGSLLSKRYSGGKSVFGHGHRKRLDWHFLHAPSGVTVLSLDRILPKEHIIPYGRHVFVVTREEFVVWARQGNPFGYNPILNRMDNLRYSSFQRCRPRSDGGGTSSGSLTSGEPAGRALISSSYHLHGHELLEVLASGYGCQDDCTVECRPGGTGGGSRDCSNRRPYA